jgi:20S proteasome alpha/beta subunit
LLILTFSFICQCKDNSTYSDSRPLGVQAAFFGFDTEMSKKPKLYLSRPSGVFSRWISLAIGRNRGE